MYSGGYKTLENPFPTDGRTQQKQKRILPARNAEAARQNYNKYPRQIEGLRTRQLFRRSVNTQNMRVWPTPLNVACVARHVFSYSFGGQQLVFWRLGSCAMKEVDVHLSSRASVPNHS